MPQAPWAVGQRFNRCSLATLRAHLNSPRIWREGLQYLRTVRGGPVPEARSVGLLSTRSQAVEVFCWRVKNFSPHFAEPRRASFRLWRRAGADLLSCLDHVDLLGMPLVIDELA